jgi:hypothetical protein
MNFLNLPFISTLYRARRNSVAYYLLSKVTIITYRQLTELFNDSKLCPFQRHLTTIPFDKKRIMANTIQNYNFLNAVNGNTYDQVTFNLPQELAFSLIGSKIYMQLRKQPSQNIFAEFTSENQKIEIIGNYTFRLKSQIISITPDTYYYDILIVFADLRRETYVGGRWTIDPAITLLKP